MRGFVQPWLLLLLAQKTSHGYELMEKLGKDQETPDADPGLLYRTLRQFEQDGLVKSSWNMESPGPARRIYEITEDGIGYLRSWVGHIRSTRERLGRFLVAYESRFKSQTAEERPAIKSQ